MVVLNKKLIVFVLLSFLFFSNKSQTSQIFDYETEVFINKILEQIQEVNQFKKDIKVKIIKDDNPNAFVISKNTIIVSSGLIEESPDYISLLAVLAHEVGHLQYLHLEKRQNSIERFSKINLISNLALITGSVLADNPQILGGAIASQANINNFYFSFTREQEREADIYSVKTLEKLMLPSNSIKKLLSILERNALNAGFDEEYQKFSTHPIFKERYEILENNSTNKKLNFDESINTRFNFIKAKFMAFNKNPNINFDDQNHKIYYESISNAVAGDLQSSLKKINFLIEDFPKYVFLLETKGDILRSHGFIKESNKFYKKVLNQYPNNYYIKYKIFLDTNVQKLNITEKNDFFVSNIDLIIQFPNNQYIVKKFIEIAITLNKEYWIDFFNIINQLNEFKKQEFKEKLFNLSEKTNDKKLKKTIYEYLKI